MSGLETAASNNLDDVHEFRVTSKIANIGLEDSSGSDISNRYEKAATGTTHTGNAGLESSGDTDVLRLFARKGSANFAALTGNAFTNSATQNRRVQTGTDSASTSIYLQLNSTGTITVSGLSATAGRWDGGTAAVAVAPRNTYQVRYSVSVNSTTGVTITNGASNWTTLNANRRVTLAHSSSAVGTWTRTFTVTVEIRRVGFTTPIVSNTFNCSTQLQISAGWNASLSDLPISVSAFANAPSDALAGIQIHSDGTIRRIVNNTNTTVGRWDNNNSSTRSGSQVRFVASGDPLLVNGATSFVATTTTRTASIGSSSGERLANVRVEIRNASNTSQIVTKNVSLSAAVDSLGGGGPNPF